MKIVWCFIFSLALSPYCGAQDTTFEMKVSKENLGLNERLRVDFVMNKDGDNFVPPSFDDFQVLMGPSQSISSSWINGKRSFSKSYSFILKPLKKGRLTIGEASVEIDGNKFTSRPKTITITEAVENPNAPKTVDDVADENLVLIAEISNDRPYLNEAITVVYKLYVGPDVQVTNFRPVESPKFNNFWSQDIPVTKFNSNNTTYKGKPFQSVVLKRVVLYPQKEGELLIEPLSLDLYVDVPTNRRDFFGGRIYAPATKRVAAGKRTITVKPLPDADKPSDFGGAVGEFEFEVTTSKKSLNAAESLQAVIAIEGKGNLGLFKMPELSLPSALEVYEPEFDEQTRTTLTGKTGKVTNAYTVVPSFQGRYPIPSVSFSFFNPKTEQYTTLNSEEITIDVIEGPQSQAAQNTYNNKGIKQTVVAGGQKFNFIKTNTTLIPITQEHFFNSQLFYLLLLLPFLFIPLVMLYQKTREKYRNDVQGNKIRKANRLAKKYLSEAKSKLAQEDEFYIALEKALHNYLKAKLKIETSEMSKEKIADILLEKNAENIFIDRLIELLKSCEMARYSPITRVQMEKDYQEASEVINALDKQL